MASSTDDKLILVTGASGFIATHIIKQLQEAGYRVRGTTRSLKNKEGVEHFKDLCPDARFELELVEADLLDSESLERAVKDADFVVHTASPLPNKALKTDDEYIKPAVEGTLNVLKACSKANTVKRVVLTSSVSAIYSKGTSDYETFNEDDWCDLNTKSPYAKSKTLAEKAAWDFIKELPDENKLEMAVINPTYVVGPVLQAKFSASMEIPQRLLEANMPRIPRLNFNVVDVRDVATAHVKALFLPEAAGHRYILGSSNMWMVDIAKLYAEEFKDQGYNVPTKICPNFLLWMAHLFSNDVRMFYEYLGKIYIPDNKKMIDVLGIKPRDGKAALIEMAYSMIERGFIEKTPKYKGWHQGSK